MFLLDTNALSELRKIASGHADPYVAAWAATQSAANFFIPTLTLMEMEIEIGVLRIERRDSEQGALLRAWMNRSVKVDFADRVLAVDGDVALRCAGLHVPDPRSERDALIAATALEHGLTVVTRNVADFEATGAPLLVSWRKYSII